MLSWSENVLAVAPSDSSTTPVTLSKEPTAEVIVPVTWAEKSLPLPTVSGRGPLEGG